MSTGLVRSLIQQVHCRAGPLLCCVLAMGGAGTCSGRARCVHTGAMIGTGFDVTLCLTAALSSYRV